MIKLGGFSQYTRNNGMLHQFEVLSGLEILVVLVEGVVVISPLPIHTLYYILYFITLTNFKNCMTVVQDLN